MTVTMASPARHAGPAPATYALPAAAAVGAFIVSFLGSWVPSLWTDEVATISAARRPLPDLFELLQTVDAVHGLYYVLMHFWTTVFGDSEVSVRMPSAIAIGLAAAGLVKIGQHVGNIPLGVAAAVIFTFLPRVVWAGTEARQYALTSMMAVALTLLLLKAWRSNRWQDWAVWGAVAALGTFLFVFFALAVAAQILASIFLRKRVLASIISAFVVLAVTAPFIIYTSGQRGQVGWIQHHSLVHNLQTYAVKQFFYGDHRPTENEPPTFIMVASVALALLLGTLAVIGLIVGTRSSRLRPVMILSLAGVAAPATLLLLGSIASPIYLARYLVFTTPAFALIAGAGLAWLLEKHRVAAVATAVAVVVVALVPQLTIKGMINTVSDDTRGVAQTVERVGSGGASVVFEAPKNRRVWLGYPEEFATLQDISLAESAQESGTIWGVNVPTDDIDLSGKGKVIYLADDSDTTGLTKAKPHFASEGCKLLVEDNSERLTLAVFQCP